MHLDSEWNGGRELDFCLWTLTGYMYVVTASGAILMNSHLFLFNLVYESVRTGVYVVAGEIRRSYCAQY